MGTVFERRGGLWLNFYDAAGRRRQVPTGLKPGQERAAAELLRDVERRIAAESSAAVALTVRAHLEVWAARREREGVAMAKDDARTIENHAAELLDLPVAEVRPKHIRDVVSRLKAAMGPGKDDLAPKTVRKVYGALHTFFESAVADEAITATPCTLPRGYLPKKVDKHPEWRSQAILARDEARALISEPLELFDRLTWGLILFTGLRTGEVSALRWRHLEFDVKPLGRMTIAFSWSREEDREKPTKTGETRLAPVHPELAKLLVEWKLSGFFERMGRHPKPDDLVLSMKDGRHINEGPRIEHLHRCLNQLGLRTQAGPARLRVHDLRRTFITLAQADGGLSSSVRSITHTGRRDILDLYTSLPWEAKCAAVAALKLEPYPAHGARVLPIAVGTSLTPVTSAVTSTDASELVTHSTAESHEAFSLGPASAQGGIRTPTPRGASPSSWCVYQFHHLGEVLKIQLWCDEMRTALYQKL